MSLPTENLDDKSFDRLVEEARKRIPVYAPHWTDHNLHDPGITLIDLFAWLAEMKIYRLNRVPPASHWQLLELVGIAPPADPSPVPPHKALENAVLAARKDMKTVARAVTADDFRTLALQTPDAAVARAIALPRYHPRLHQIVPGIVTVIVVPDPAQTDPLAPRFTDAVLQHINPHRMLTTRLFVTLPQYITVRIKARVVIKPEVLPLPLQKKVTQRLDAFLHPLSGGNHKKGWPFGRPLYRSEILTVIDGVPGVDYVETGSLQMKKGPGQWLTGDIPIPPHALVESGPHIITASVNHKGGQYD